MGRLLQDVMTLRLAPIRERKRQPDRRYVSVSRLRYAGRPRMTMPRSLVRWCASASVRMKRSRGGRSDDLPRYTHAQIRSNVQSMLAE